MCGIAGVICRDPERSPDKAVLDRMVDRLHHRGPDEQGAITLPGIGLGMKRLSIVDVAGGQQPLRSDDSNLSFVGNGEIYNHQSLRAELRDKGYRFRTSLDLEVIIHGYAEWGDGIVERLGGMFAFALWDAKKRRLLVARDRAGEKPLYFYEGRDEIVFASEIKSILTRPEVPRRLDHEALDCFLTYEFIIAPKTIFKDIKKLPPASYMVFADGRLTTRRYWRPVVPDSDSVEASRSAEEWASELKTCLGRAVESQMMSDVPLGAFLSGGIDSSSVVGFMSSVSREPVRTFSIGFEDGTYDERRYARQVAHLFGTSHREEIIQPDIREMFDRLIVHLDEPFADTSLFPTFMVSEVAASEVKVVLSGDGGDELFAGYDWYLAQRLASQLSRFAGANLIEAMTRLAALVPPTAKKKGLVNKGKRFFQGLSHDPSLAHYRWLWHLPESEKDQLYSPSLRQALGEYDPADPVSSVLSEMTGGSLNRSLYADFRLFLADDILVKVDRMSMASSLEARAPFLDRDVIDLAFRIPETLKLRGSQRKYILKKAMAGMLPNEILYRRKEGFSIPMKNWLKKDLRSVMLELLSDSRLKRRGLFETPAVQRRVREHLEGRANHAHQLFPLMVFERWAEAFLD